jgi:hypothetical protein
MATARQNLLHFSLSFEPHDNTYGEKSEMHALVFAQYDVFIENNQYVDDCNVHVMF